MVYSFPNSLGSPGGFDPERAVQTNKALSEILGKQAYEVEQRSLGRLALIRCAQVEGEKSDYLLVERRLRTGMFIKRATNSFEVAFSTTADQEPDSPLCIVSDFRYLPYRDGLSVTRHLYDRSVDSSQEEIKRANFIRIQEIVSGIVAASADDWSEFQRAIDDMRFGNATPLSTADLYG